MQVLATMRKLLRGDHVIVHHALQSAVHKQLIGQIDQQHRGGSPLRARRPSHALRTIFHVYEEVQFPCAAQRNMNVLGVQHESLLEEETPSTSQDAHTLHTPSRTHSLPLSTDTQGM